MGNTFVFERTQQDGSLVPVDDGARGIGPIQTIENVVVDKLSEFDHTEQNRVKDFAFGLAAAAAVEEVSIVAAPLPVLSLRVCTVRICFLLSFFMSLTLSPNGKGKHVRHETHTHTHNPTANTANGKGKGKGEGKRKRRFNGHTLQGVKY